MRLSKRSEYGLIAAVRLAQRRREGGTYLRSRQIADEESLPAKFLEAILLNLKGAEILESKVGAGGGYRLSRSPEQIRLSEIVLTLEPDASTINESETHNGHDRTTSGQRALIEVNRRLFRATESALGSLTLEDLLEVGDTGEMPSLGGASAFRPSSGESEDRQQDEAAL